MNLIEIKTNDKNEQLVSARELYKKLEVTERFNSWFSRMLKYGFIEDEDFTSVKDFTVVNNGAKKEIDDYILKLDTAKQICMLQRSEIGTKIRKYFIEVEKAWNNPEMVLSRALQVANRNIITYKEEIKKLETKIEEDKHKVAFAETVSKSDDTILIREFAKLLSNSGIEIGERRLYKWLRDNGYIVKKGTEPTQKAINMGLFKVSERVISTGDKSIVSLTTRVTGKGQTFLSEKLMKVI